MITPFHLEQVGGEVLLAGGIWKVAGNSEEQQLRCGLVFNQWKKGHEQLMLNYTRDNASVGYSGRG